MGGETRYEWKTASPRPKFPRLAADFSEARVRLALSQAASLYRRVHSLIRSGVMTHVEDVILSLIPSRVRHTKQ